MLSQGQRQGWGRRTVLMGLMGIMATTGSLAVGPMQAAQAENAGPTASLAFEEGLVQYNPQTQVAGSLRVQGSDTMSLLMSRLAGEFQRRQPNVSINVSGGGSTKAVNEFIQPPAKLSGKIALKEERPTYVSLVASSRELLDAEVKQFVAQHGYEPTGIPVAVDAVALYVHRDNPIQGLTLDQVDAMFSTTHNRGLKANLSQWGALGLQDGWEKAPVRLYGRDRRSGTRAFFQEHCLAGGEFAPTLREEPGAASVILDLTRDQLGIGYSGLGLETSSVRIVPLAENQGMPFVAPTAATVSDQTYPLRRMLYLYVDKSPKAPLAPAVQEFLTFVTSREGQEAVMKAGFFPLPLNQVKKNFLALGLTGQDATLTN